MSHFDDNQYRVRPLLPGVTLTTKPLGRISAIRVMAEWLRLGNTISDEMKFAKGKCPHRTRKH
jgi:hypothetical protein